MPDQYGNLTPADLGYLGWSLDPRGLQGSVAIASNGRPLIARIPLLPGFKTISQLVIGIVTAGATLTAGQCFGAVYDNAWNLIDITGDQSANWLQTGLTGGGGTAAPMTLRGPATGLWPYVWGAVLCNGTTGPALVRGATAGPTTTGAVYANGLAPALNLTPFLAHNAAAQTAMPQQINPQTANSQAVFMAVA